MEFVVDDLRNGYVDVLRRVLRAGKPVAPRGQPTREVRGATITLLHPFDALPVGVGRGTNPRIAAIEAAQLVGACSVPDVMISISKHFDQFTDDGRFYGAYGVRITDQLHHVVRKLQEDSSTRQAVITLWNPELDNDPGFHDYPCTTALFFLIRNDKLELDVTMRSNDAVLGLAYDAFMFTRAQLTVAQVLGIEVGPYRHHAVSLHIYERDLDVIDKLHWAPDGSAPPPGGAFGAPGGSIAEAELRARAICEGAWSPEWTPTLSEAWYIMLLQDHV